jgi:hypothetical protein
MLQRLGVAFGVLFATLLLTAAPAAAKFTENKIGCKGSAVITDDQGKTTSITAEDDDVKVPTKGSAAWEGAVTTTTHNHFGEVKLKLGFIKIALGDWGKSSNANDNNSAKGVKKIPSAVEQLPAGKYVVEGFHQGDEGRCAGKVTVELDASATSNPVGIVSLAGTVLTGALLVFSAMGSAAKAAVR